MTGSDLASAPWRTGTHYGIHLYAGDEPIGTMLTPELADAAVEAHNAVAGACGTGEARISGENPQREYADALAAHSRALAEVERTERLVARAKAAADPDGRPEP